MPNSTKSADMEVYPANQGIEIHCEDSKYQNPILLQVTAYHPGAFIPILYISQTARDIKSNYDYVNSAKEALEKICKNETPVFQDGKPTEVPEYWANQILKMLKVDA